MTLDTQDPTLLLDGPPEEEFWRRYNKRLEFPLSTAMAVLFHALVAGLLVLTWSYFMKKEDKSGVVVSLVPEMDGLDDSGEGSAGSGGVVNPRHPEQNAFPQLPDVPNPAELPKIKQDLSKLLQFEGESNIPISNASAAAYRHLDQTLQQKLLGIGGKKGVGPGDGGGEEGKGAGPGGTGANSTRARSLRWVMRFRTSGGDDYLAQLRALKAVILVPIPPENKRCHYFRDLNDLGSRTIASDTELGALNGLIRFTDPRPDSVRAVCDELGVKENAKVFFAYFPKEMEAELARKEIGFMNRRPEDVEETVFRVVPTGSGYMIVVDSQKPK